MVSISPIVANITATSIPSVWNKFALKDGVPNNRLLYLKDMPWIKDKSIAIALVELKKLKFDSKDLMYLKSIGVNVPFKSGEDAYNFIKKQNVRILFEPTSERGVHAQYDYYKNLIVINEKYKNVKDFAVILAISEAILHETGHAKDKDGHSSIQEELDFLGLNAIAHRAYLREYGDVFLNLREPIISDGVSVYSKLFFDADPDKISLKKRIAEKCGELPQGDSVHPAGKIAQDVKCLYRNNLLNYLSN